LEQQTFAFLIKYRIFLIGTNSLSPLRNI